MSEITKGLVIGNSAVPSLIITVVFMLVIPVTFFVYWRRKFKLQTNLRYLIAGAVGFMVSARILELGVHYLCIIADNPVSRFINGHTLAYALYGITMAGVFEECGRYIVLRFIMKKNRTVENAVLYGIGHGGIEILGVILPAMISYLVIAVLLSGSIENAFSVLNITEETVSAALPSLLAAATYNYTTMFMSVIERIFAMFVHIGLSVVVYIGVVKAKKSYLFAAILLHMLADTFPAFYQRGVLPLWAVEVWAACWAVGIVLYAWKAANLNQVDKVIS